MKIGMPAYDDQRRDLAGLVELLDQDPTHTNVNEHFLGRFHTLQVVVQEYFAREESLMQQLEIPEDVQKRHIEAHDAITNIFLDVYMDSMNHVQKSALEVYWQVREVLRLHYLNFDISLKPYVEKMNQ